MDDNDDESNIYRVVGGTFDHFNDDYRGGSGFSDVAVEDTYLIKAMDITNLSITKLREVIKEFQAENRRMITEKEFNSSVNINHPLMQIKNMNLIYFFYGHGQRLIFKPINDKEFKLYSIYKNKDAEFRKQVNKEEDTIGTLGEDILFFALKILGIIFGFILIVLSIVGLIFYIRKKRRN